MEINILFWIFVLLAEIMGTIAGFGSSTLLLPIALFFFNFQTALVLTAIAHISGDLGKIIFFKNKVNKKLLLYFGIPSIFLAITGALLVNQFSQPLFKIILAFFLLGFVAISIVNPSLSLKVNKRNEIVGGSVSGFFSGLIGTGGAIRSAFLSAFEIEKSAYIFTIASISLVTDITRIPIYLYNGFLTHNYLLFVPIIFILSITGAFIGKKIVTKIDQETFRKFVLIAIALTSIKLLYDGFNALN